MQNPTLADGPRRFARRPDEQVPEANGAPSHPPAPGERWGRYVIESLLGEGGMGRVYAALDPALERRVALKVVRSTEPVLIERFVAEARAQARVEHDHVCRVYEVGEVGGQPYIAMQLVLGGTLRQPPPDLKLAELPLEERARLMALVAEGVHAAHKTGLIHRDIKPGNILLERTETGRYRPFVTDFGIARAIDRAGLTRTGTVIGTVGYMAPEQALGEDATPDRRLDIYGLGATLYELVAGQPPYSGANDAQLLVQLVTEDPVPLARRCPELPPDLGTIVMRCLERDPEQRYASARALAEDLRRFVDGEPILARPTSWSYRLGRKIRKHKGLAVLALGAALAVATLATLWLHTRWQSGRRAALAQRFGEEAQGIEGDLRIARLLPLHDTSPERAAARARIDRLEAQVRQGGELAAGPGRYALGRAFLALAEPVRARRELDQAWSAGYRSAEVRYALGMALGELYQQALDRVEGLADLDQRRLERARAERELRDPALEHLQAARTQRGDPAFVEGLIALYDRRYDEALAKARQAYGRQPALYEAKRLEGDVYVSRGVRQAEGGLYDQAQASYAEAESAYHEALAIARSDAALLRAECLRRLRVLELASRRGGAAAASFESAVEGCRQPLAADSRQVEAYTHLAFAHWSYGDFVSDHGDDPRPLLDQAEAFAGRALELAPHDATAASHAGTAAVLRAEWESDHGMDPRPALERAVASFEHALSIDPDSGLAYNEKGLAYFTRGRYELWAGLDPRPSFEAAIEAYRQAQRLTPDYANAIQNLALALDNEADYEAAIGLDPRPRRQQANEQYQRALAIDPNRVLYLSNMGGNMIKLGEYELSQGLAPLAAIDGAIAALEAARRVDPTFTLALGNLSNAYLLRGEHELAIGKDPRAALEHCIALNDEALAGNPRSALARGTQGQAWLSIARYEARNGLDPRRSLAQSKAALTDCGRMNPLLKGQLAPIEAAVAVLEREAHKAGPRRTGG